MQNKDTPDGEFLMGLYRDSIDFYYKHRDLIPSDEQYQEAMEFFNEITELNLNLEQTKGILDLYPLPRITLAAYTTMDTDTRDQLSFAIAHFFLGCSWPMFKDKVDIDAFVELLKDQAKQMGFN